MVLRLFVFAITAIYLSFFVFAQEIQVASQEEYKNFLRTKTYIVKTDNPFSRFNTEIEKAMTQNWKLTQWEMISAAEFEKKRRDKNASFIFLSEAQSEKEPQMKLNILNVVLGSPSGNINKMPDVATIPLSYVTEDEEFTEDEYLFKLPVFLKFIQYYIQVNAQKITPARDLVRQHSTYLIQKEIWLTPEQLDAELQTPEKIARHYKGKVKIVSDAQIRQAVIDQKKDVVIAHIVAPEEGKTGKALKILIEIATGIPFYYDIANVPSGKSAVFTAADFKKF